MSSSSEATRPGEPERVLFVRTGEREVTAVAPGGPGDGWWSLFGTARDAVAPHLVGKDGTPASNARARLFTMRPEDLSAWDSLGRKGDAGYSYGTLWGDKGIAKNVQIREATAAGRSAGSLPPLDPIALGLALAVAQLQADIRRLAEVVEQVASNVEAILQFLHISQEAAVLAATDTIDQIHARYRDELSVCQTDWERLAGLEQVLKSQHRQIVGELVQVARALEFSSAAEIERAGRLDPARVEKLIQLEWYLLLSLEKWGELMLATKARRAENTSTAAAEIRHLREDYLGHARSVLETLRGTDGGLTGRGLWDRFLADGLVYGWWKDKKAENVATSRRAEIRQLAAVVEQLPESDPPPLIRVDIADAPPRETAASAQV